MSDDNSNPSLAHELRTVLTSLQGRIEGKLDSLQHEVHSINIRLTSLESVKDDVQVISKRLENMSNSRTEQTSQIAVAASERTTMGREINAIKKTQTDVRQDITSLQISFAERYGIPALIAGSITALVQLIAFLTTGSP